MYIKNRAFALIFRCLILLACGMGLYVFSGIRYGDINIANMIYFTNISNLACFILYIFLTAKTALNLKNGSETHTTKALTVLKSAITMMLVITMLIYHIMLQMSGFAMFAATSGITIRLANMMLHYVTPSMVVLDWLLFDKKNTYRWFYPLLWLVIPFVYLVFTFVRAEISGAIVSAGSRFPYFFMDVDVLGWAGVLRYVVILFFAFTALGYVLLLIDRGISLRSKQQSETV